MFAQDTRKLVYDGAPPSSVDGTDLHGEYFDFGYKYFKDENVIPKNHFIAADILDENDPGLKPIQHHKRNTSHQRLHTRGSTQTHKTLHHAPQTR
jgi:hypothetical protein